ncbi:MAG: AMP-binding protein, partial [Rhodococcus sp. (in: high G+C Gram-positive bacteria)]
MSTVVNSEREDHQQPSHPSTLGAWLLGQHDPTRPAIVIDGKTKTFGELISKVNQLSNKFASLGLRKGDVAAGLLSNGAEYYEIALACMQSG